MRTAAVWSAVGLVACVAGCTSSPRALSPITVATPAGSATIPAPGSASPSGSAPPSGSASTSGSASQSASASAPGSPSASPSPTGPPTSSSNLKVDDGVRSALLAAFRATKAAPTSVFTGPDAGSVYYAYLAPTKTYWALGHFTLGSGSTTQQQVSMQDAGSGGLFSHVAGQPWKDVGYDGGAGPYPCPGDLDPELLTLWHMRYDQHC